MGRKVWREGRCFGLSLGMEEELELILSTSHGARSPWPISGLHIYDRNTDGLPWAQIIIASASCKLLREKVKEALIQGQWHVYFSFRRRPWKKSNG